MLCRPAGAIDDLFVHADYDRVTGAGRLRVDADVPVRVTVPELGVDVAGGEEVVLERVEPWSAEIPRLYDGVVASAGERVAVRIGFRRVTVEDGRLLVNGYRVLVNGVGPGDDVERLKAHNVDAVLVSGCAPEFLERCDELGLYVVYECDVSTRGFAEVGWRRNPIDDPAWEPALVDRLRRTVERDKNHPSIILWSLAGESGTGRNLPVMAAWARARDPSRPLYYAHDASCRDVEVDLLGRGEHLPVRITGSNGTVRIENLHAFRDLSYLSFVWALEDEGVPVAEGTLRVGALPAGAVAEPPLPALPAVHGEAWLTVRAVLAADEPWAPAGHEVAWGQLQIAPAPPPTVARAPARWRAWTASCWARRCSTPAAAPCAGSATSRSTVPGSTACSIGRSASSSPTTRSSSAPAPRPEAPTAACSRPTPGAPRTTARSRSRSTSRRSPRRVSLPALDGRGVVRPPRRQGRSLHRTPGPRRPLARARRPPPDRRHPADRAQPRPPDHRPAPPPRPPLPNIEPTLRGLTPQHSAKGTEPLSHLHSRGLSP